MAVNAAVREQTKQMQVRIADFAVVDRREDLGIFKELAVLDFLGDSGQFLINDTACAHIHVADFRVAHLAIRKTY